MIDGGAVVIGDDGSIQAVGESNDLRSDFPAAEVREVEGVLFPGFVDCHTHAVFGAARLADHERRALGITYKEIAAQGGGILSSVRDVRGRGVDDLARLTRIRMARLLEAGTTTVEIKSGYGLSLESELAQLEAVRQVAGDGAPAVVATFLGAHEVPPEHKPARLPCSLFGLLAAAVLLLALCVLRRPTS